MLALALTFLTVALLAGHFYFYLNRAFFPFASYYWWLLLGWLIIGSRGFSRRFFVQMAFIFLATGFIVRWLWPPGGDAFISIGFLLLLFSYAKI